MLKNVKLFALVALASSAFAGANVVTKIEKDVLKSSSGKYDITGYFAKYAFSDDVKSNWTFTFSDKYGGATYQLLGDTSDENIQKNGVFGWVKKDVTPNPPEYYMVQYEPTAFGWLVFSVDENGNCKNVYKLAGQNPTTKSFSYDVDEDGTTDVLSDLECKVTGGSVEFYSPILQTETSIIGTTDNLMPPPIPNPNLN